MAATENLRQLSQSHNSASELIVPRHGSMTLFGYGVKVRVERGHLLLEGGIGADRRHARLPRVGHGLKRLVVIGSDGMVSLAALRWLADQDASLVLLERDGKVLAVTGPTQSSDARLRRAQALAHTTGAALRISRELISQKLVAQEQVARNKLLAEDSADVIARYCAELPAAETLERVRLIESRAASVYWSLFRDLPVNFPRKDLSRVPHHWRRFGTRSSPLTGSPRRAANPANALLNFAYSILESESRLAASALGLDPGLGVLHVDTPARDSLACDVMEAVRPQVDSFLIDWITREVLRREWFFERADGNCRLASSLAIRLSETAAMWGRAVAPIAEWVAQSFWNSPRKRSIADQILPTRLTQRRKTEAKGHTLNAAIRNMPSRENICRTCGKTIRNGIANCRDCAIEQATVRLTGVACKGRVLSQSAEAQTKRAETQRKNALAQHAWNPATETSRALDWEQIWPSLAGTSASVIAKQIGVSRYYATLVRAGRRRPHQRHWQALAKLTGISKGIWIGAE
jgi:CRISPR-associated endonuclease Cas1